LNDKICHAGKEEIGGFLLLSGHAQIPKCWMI